MAEYSAGGADAKGRDWRQRRAGFSKKAEPRGEFEAIRKWSSGVKKKADDRATSDYLFNKYGNQYSKNYAGGETKMMRNARRKTKIKKKKR